MKYSIHLFIVIAFLFSCKEPIEIPKNSDKIILSFTIEGAKPITIDTLKKQIIVTVGTEIYIKSMVPKIIISDKAQISPASEMPQDFSKPVKYTVTAEDGSIVVYTVIVNQIKSSQKQILSLSFDKSTIVVKIDSNQKDYLIEVPLGTQIEYLKPIFKISDKATISSFYNDEYKDFSRSQIFRVTAEDGSYEEYSFKLYFEIKPKVANAPNPGKDLLILSVGTTLNAYDALTGTLVWSYNNNGGSIFCNPSYHKGNVYFTSGMGLAVVDVNNGKGVYRADTRENSESTPVFFEGNMYFGSGQDGIIRANNITTGEKIWNTDSYYWSNSSPTIANGKLFMSIKNGNSLNAYDLKTGKILWSTGDDFSLGSFSGIANPAVYQNLVISKQPGSLTALDQSTGNKVWSFTETDAGGSSSPSISDDRVYFGANNGKIYALNAKTGSKIWEINTLGDIDSSPFIDVNFGYIASKDGFLYAFSKDKGEIKWKFEIGKDTSTDFISSSPVVAKGIVYIFGEDRNFYALNSLTGAKIFSIPNVSYQSLSSALIVLKDGTSVQSGISGATN